MRTPTKIILFAFAFLFFPFQVFSQSQLTKTIELDLTQIKNPDLRYLTSYAIAHDDNLVYSLSEDDEHLFIRSAEGWDELTLQRYYDEMTADIQADFNIYQHAQKEIQGEMFASWKEGLPKDLFSALFRLMLIETSEIRDDDGNQTCATADPFCTTDIVTFHVDASVNGSCESGPNYDCMSSFTNRPPFWFYMKIGNPGTFTIRITNSANLDLDFCAWGPFSDPVTPCPNQLTSNKVIDCDSPSNTVQECTIPSSATTGQYYLMVITKYSSGSTDISFSKKTNSGSGETDCSIMPPLVNNDGPYCVGDAIHLSGNAQAGASYQWSGPNGFTSNQQNPVINNCNLSHTGTYTCTITVGSQHSTASTDVNVYAVPTANFSATSVCQGNATTFTNSSTTNPSGQAMTYRWNFGDGQTSNQTNPTHQYASAGNYTVTLTANCGNGACSNVKSQTVTVYASPVANAGQDQTITYGGTATLQGSGGVGSFNFQWEPADKVVNPHAAQTQTIALTETTTFTLTASSTQGGCTSTDQVNVLVQGSAMSATANATPSSICQGESTQLQATAVGGTGNYTYSWAPATNLSDPHIPNPIATPTQTTNYTCIINDGQTSQTTNVNVTVNLPEHEEETQYICPGEVFPFYDGTVISEVGDYDYQTTTAQGCDKTITVHLLHYPAYENGHTETAYICSGDSYPFHGQNYYTTGTYSKTLQTIHGCDSVVWLNLTVYPPNDTLLVDPEICENQSYIFHGTEYTQDGAIAYFDTIDDNGCLQVEKLLLTVGEYQTPPIQVENICYAHDGTPSFTWDKNGQTYHEDAYDEIILPDPNGDCDIRYRLNLRFHQEFYHEETIVECDEYVWPVTGERFTSTNHHIERTFDHYVNSNFKCDSTYVLDLTINSSKVGTKIVNDICDSYTWNFGWDGESYTYTESGDYTRTIPTALGCDSTVTLKLNLEYTPDFPRVEGKSWVVGGSEFQYNIESYWIEPDPRAEHSTNWYFADPTFNQWEIVFPDSFNHDYCLLYIFTFERDSIELCATTQGPCGTFTHSRWIHCGYHGVQEIRPEVNVSIFPNPNDGHMTLAFENMSGTADIQVMDLTGLVVDRFQVPMASERTAYPYDPGRLSPGAYFFSIKSKEGTLVKKVIIMK